MFYMVSEVKDFFFLTEDRWILPRIGNYFYLFQQQSFSTSSSSSSFYRLVNNDTERRWWGPPWRYVVRNIVCVRSQACVIPVCLTQRCPKEVEMKNINSNKVGDFVRSILLQRTLIITVGSDPGQCKKDALFMIFHE